MIFVLMGLNKITRLIKMEQPVPKISQEDIFRIIIDDLTQYQNWLTALEYMQLRFLNTADHFTPIE